MRKVLSKKFFEGSAVEAAKSLLGKFLVRRYRGKEIFAEIVEVEAYDGRKDKASHASRGLTARNKVMFGEAGYWYVYFTYGMHWMLNIVTGPKDYPAAVLIRAVELSSEIKKGHFTNLNGPARLTKHLKIDKFFNNKAASKKNGLWVEDRGIKIPPRRIKRTKRVGVEYAGHYWANRRHRFLLA